MRNSLQYAKITEGKQNCSSDHKTQLVSSLFEQIDNVQKEIDEAFEILYEEEALSDDGLKECDIQGTSLHKLAFSSPFKGVGSAFHGEKKDFTSTKYSQIEEMPRVFKKPNKMRKIQSEPLGLNSNVLNDAKNKKNELGIFEGEKSTFSQTSAFINEDASSSRLFEGFGSQLAKIDELSFSLESLVRLSYNVVECQCAN